MAPGRNDPALPEASLARLEVTVDLGASGFRQLGYSASCVVARRYALATLPAGRGELVGRRLFVVALLVVAGSTLVGATR